MTPAEAAVLRPSTTVWWRRQKPKPKIPATVERVTEDGVTIRIEYGDGTKSTRTVPPRDLDLRQDVLAPS